MAFLTSRGVIARQSVLPPLGAVPLQVHKQLMKYCKVYDITGLGRAVVQIRSVSMTERQQSTQTVTDTLLPIH